MAELWRKAKTAVGQRMGILTGRALPVTDRRSAAQQPEASEDLMRVFREYGDEPTSEEAALIAALPLSDGDIRVIVDRAFEAAGVVELPTPPEPPAQESVSFDASGFTLNQTAAQRPVAPFSMARLITFPPSSLETMPGLFPLPMYTYEIDRLVQSAREMEELHAENPARQVRWRETCPGSYFSLRFQDRLIDYHGFADEAALYFYVLAAQASDGDA